VNRVLRAILAAEAVVAVTGFLRSRVDKAVAASIKRTEAPTGAESFGADLDALVKTWRKRGELDRHIKVELLRKADSL
jgi:hypothetical protein